MQNRVNRTLAAAVAGVAVLGLAATAGAQTPARRIPVTKDRVPVDTMTRVDTVTVTRVDTVTVTRRDTITREVSTGVLATETPMVKLPGAFYFQLGGGATLPQRQLNDAFDTGFNVTGSLGWQPVNTALGLRFDVSYDRVMGEEIGGLTDDRYDDASVWSGLAEATLNLPFGNRASGSGLYLIGGGGIHRFNDYRDLSVNVGTGEGESTSTDWGVNGGAGLRFGWGPAALFVESRYFHVFTEHTETNFVPIVAGFTFR